ncbi:hypothetical protein BJ742DRAFT_797624 [Cladochytrium replicatum]|nr:hypothetical protein BJ742DRAFT_797624 [Cladochytrium replicatum]
MIVAQASASGENTSFGRAKFSQPAMIVDLAFAGVVLTVVLLVFTQAITAFRRARRPRPAFVYYHMLTTLALLVYVPLTTMMQVVLIVNPKASFIATQLPQSVVLTFVDIGLNLVLFSRILLFMGGDASGTTKTWIHIGCCFGIVLALGGFGAAIYSLIAEGFNSDLFSNTHVPATVYIILIEIVAMGFVSKACFRKLEMQATMNPAGYSADRHTKSNNSHTISVPFGASAPGGPPMSDDARSYTAYPPQNRMPGEQNGPMFSYPQHGPPQQQPPLYGARNGPGSDAGARNWNSDSSPWAPSSPTSDGYHPYSSRADQSITSSQHPMRPHQQMKQIDPPQRQRALNIFNFLTHVPEDHGMIKATLVTFMCLIVLSDLSVVGVFMCPLFSIDTCAAQADAMQLMGQIFIGLHFCLSVAFLKYVTRVYAGATTRSSSGDAARSGSHVR